jgi:hypothetical protein
MLRRTKHSNNEVVAPKEEEEEEEKEEEEVLQGSANVKLIFLSRSLNISKEFVASSRIFFYHEERGSMLLRNIRTCRNSNHDNRPPTMYEHETVISVFDKLKFESTEL